MPLIKYIGLKADGERAYFERTGIVWMPGDAREVSAEHAALLLPHTDVWDIAEPLPVEPPGEQVTQPADTGLAAAKPKTKAKKG